jgi:hypothetical protein
VAAPVFAAVARQVLPYLGVPPDEPFAAPAPPMPPVLVAERESMPPAVADGTMPDLRGLSARQALALAVTVGLDPDLHGSGFVARQSPPPGAALGDSPAAVDLWLGTSGSGE